MCNVLMCASLKIITFFKTKCIGKIHSREMYQLYTISLKRGLIGWSDTRV